MQAVLGSLLTNPTATRLESKPLEHYKVCAPQECTYTVVTPKTFQGIAYDVVEAVGSSLSTFGLIFYAGIFFWGYVVYLLNPPKGKVDILDPDSLGGEEDGQYTTGIHHRKHLEESYAGASREAVLSSPISESGSLLEFESLKSTTAQLVKELESLQRKISFLETANQRNESGGGGGGVYSSSSGSGSVGSAQMNPTLLSPHSPVRPNQIVPYPSPSPSLPNMAPMQSATVNESQFSPSSQPARNPQHSSVDADPGGDVGVFPSSPRYPATSSSSRSDVGRQLAVDEGASPTAPIQTRALSPNWVEVSNPGVGKPYFYHRTTREVRWEAPLETTTTTTAAPAPQIVPSSPQYQSYEGQMAQSLPQGWSRKVTEGGRHYYTNVELGKSQWEHPSLQQQQQEDSLDVLASNSTRWAMGQGMTLRTERDPR